MEAYNCSRGNDYEKGRADKGKDKCEDTKEDHEGIPLNMETRPFIVLVKNLMVIMKNAIGRMTSPIQMGMWGTKVTFA